MLDLGFVFVDVFLVDLIAAVNVGGGEEIRRTAVFTRNFFSSAADCLKKGSADAEKIVSEVESIIHVSDDLSMILYKKDGSLCRMKNGKDPEKIASDVAEIWVAYDSGECYYTKKEEDTIRYLPLYAL